MAAALAATDAVSHSAIVVAVGVFSLSVMPG
jgi:hypothetical protein